MHKYHQTEDQEQVQREQGYMDVVGDQAEQGRHQAAADVDTGHLNADQSLGMLGTEMLRGGVDHAGVDGGTAQANEDQAGNGSPLTQRQEHGADQGYSHFTDLAEWGAGGASRRSSRQPL